jgi:hypothetical protein
MSSKLFCWYRETDSKVDTETQKLRITNSVWKENKDGEVTLSNFKTYNKIIANKTMW